LQFFDSKVIKTFTNFLCRNSTNDWIWSNIFGNIAPINKALFFVIFFSLPWCCRT
jgi:hypothetical protein